MSLHAGARDHLDQGLAGHVWGQSDAMWREAVAVLTELYLDAWQAGYTVPPNELWEWAHAQDWSAEDVAELLLVARTIEFAFRHARIIIR